MQFKAILIICHLIVTTSILPFHESSMLIFRQQYRRIHMCDKPLSPIFATDIVHKFSNICRQYLLSIFVANICRQYLWPPHSVCIRPGSPHQSSLCGRPPGDKKIAKPNLQSLMK